METYQEKPGKGGNEIAAFLTFLSAGLLAIGVFVGSYFTRQTTRINSQAAGEKQPIKNFTIMTTPALYPAQPDNTDTTGDSNPQFTSFSPANFQETMTDWTNGEVSTVDMSFMVNQATRNKGLQIKVCYPNLPPDDPNSCQ